MKQNTIMKNLYSKKFLIQLLLLLILSGLSAQKNTVKLAPPPTSTVIFPQNFSSNENLNFYYNNVYIEKNHPDANYIFRKDGQVEYKDYSPGDYVLEGTMGRYSYQNEDFIQIIADNTNFSHRKIDRIESKINKEGVLKFEILNEDGSEAGKITILNYDKWPTFIFKSQSLSISQYNLDQKILNRKIVLNRLSVQLDGEEKRRNINVNVNIKMKPVAMTYSIILKEDSYHIKNQNGKIFLYQWDSKKQEFTKKNELILRR